MTVKAIQMPSAACTCRLVKASVWKDIFAREDLPVGVILYGSYLVRRKRDSRMSERVESP